LFVHEGDPGKAEFQAGAKFAVREITLEALSLDALRVKNKHRGSPQHVKTMKVGGTFFDVCLDGHEVFTDECRGRFVCVGFGFQPNAPASDRRRAKIDQDRFVV
jgi:hypothetical protein